MSAIRAFVLFRGEVAPFPEIINQDLPFVAARKWDASKFQDPVSLKIRIPRRVPTDHLKRCKSLREVEG